MASGKHNSDRQRIRRTKMLFWCTGCIALAGNAIVQAASWTWVGGAGGTTGTPTSANWNAANAWSSSTSPTGGPPADNAATILQFNGSGFTPYTSTSNLNGFSFGSIILNSSASVQQTITGNSPVENAAITIDQQGAGSFLIGMSIQLDTRQLTLKGGGTGTVTISGNLTGKNSSKAMTLVKNDASTFVLTGANLDWGTTTINAGVLQIGAGTTTGNLGALGAVTNNASLVFRRSDNITVNNQFSGTGSLTQSGGGVLTLSNTSTYSGDTIIANGTLKIANAAAIPSGAGKGNVVLNGGAANAGIFDLGGLSPTINGLSGTTGTVLGQVLNSTAATTANLTVGSNNTTSSFAGVIRDNAGTGGTVRLTRTGSGVLTLSGANTYTGTTTVSGGTLRVNGTHTGGDSYTISSGGSLGGGGAITLASAKKFTFSGDVSPGNSVGSLTLNTPGGNGTTTGVTELAAGGSYTWEINSQTGSAGTSWDLLTLGAVAVTATNTPGQQFTINIVSLNGSTPGPTPGWTPGSPEAPKTFTIATSSTNSFSAADIPKFFINTSQFQDAYPATGWSVAIGNSGGSLDLVYTPEPSSAATIVIAGATLLRRRRRARH